MQAIFLDIETTGLNTQIHRVLDIAFKVININTKEVICQYQSIVRLSPQDWLLHDPSSIQINGFTWEQSQTGKDPEVIGQEILEVLNSIPIKRGQAVFLCQNPAFDRGFFNQLVDVYVQERYNWPYHWLDLASMFWTVSLLDLKQKGEPFPEEMTISKNAIAKHYSLPEEIPPHRAMQGVEHLIACYDKVFAK